MDFAKKLLIHWHSLGRRISSSQILSFDETGQLKWEALTDLQRKGELMSSSESEEVQKTISLCAKSAVRIVTLIDPEYPRSFLQLEIPPLVLFVRGSLDWPTNGICVVGSRKPSLDSVRWMEQELCAFLEKTSATVVSGGARGVDQLAHRMAIRSKTPTFVFLPSGIMDPYPPELRDLFPWVLDGGGSIISAFPIHTRVQKAFFFSRNHLMAQLSAWTLVVEAAERSGTMMTAQIAGHLGKDVGVVPQSYIYSGARGGLQLLREGAKMVCDRNDLQDLHKEFQR